MKAFDISNEKYHMGHFVWDSLSIRPDAICQIDAATGESETNASVFRRSVQFARCLLRFGARTGDVLALGGNNHLDLHIPYYAATMIGMPLTGVDPQFKYIEIKQLLKICSPKIAFCQKKVLVDYLRVIEELNLDTKLVCFDDDTDYSINKFIEQYDDVKDHSDFKPLNYDADIYGWLLGTGGTTGVIKLAAITHRKIFRKMEDLALTASFPRESIEKIPTDENELCIILSPVQWISGFLCAILNPAMKVTKLMTSSPITTDHVIDIINKYRPRQYVGSPSSWMDIVKSDKECDITCFKTIAVIGSSARKELLMEIQKRVRPGTLIHQTYGQTENIGPVFVPNPLGPIGNCGCCRFDWQKNIKLVNPETGVEIAEPNVPGEVWTKVTSFTEYYNNPEETKMAFTEDGWYKTGDMLYRDADGNYYFVERIKLLIKYRNYHVFAPEIEAVILSHPGVEDVSVTSIPHDEDGEHVVACVVRRKGSPVTAQEIKEFVADKRSDSQRLRGGVVFIDKIPLTSAGKVSRNKIKQFALTAHRE